MTRRLNEQRCLVIMGQAGSGKDTLGGMISEFQFGTATDSGFNVLKFSQPLKRLCCDIFGWDIDKMDDLVYKDENIDTGISKVENFHVLGTRRKILQYLGTDVFRKMDKDIWVKATMRDAAAEYSGSCGGWLATDVRFKNEQAAIVTTFKDSLFVKIHRLGATTSHSTNHPTEAISKLYCDMEFYVEDGDLSRLREVARLIAQDFFKTPKHESHKTLVKGVPDTISFIKPEMVVEIN